MNTAGREEFEIWEKAKAMIWQFICWVLNLEPVAVDYCPPYIDTRIPFSAFPFCSTSRFLTCNVCKECNVMKYTSTLYLVNITNTISKKNWMIQERGLCILTWHSYWNSVDTLCSSMFRIFSIRLDFDVDGHMHLTLDIEWMVWGARVAWRAQEVVRSDFGFGWMLTDLTGTVRKWQIDRDSFQQLFLQLIDGCV